MKIKAILWVWIFWGVFGAKVFAQDSLQFLAYSNIPTWVAVASDWQTKPVIHLYDSKVYKGHADFVNRGLGRKIMFPEFKNLVKSHQKRQYIPFFIYDLRKKPFVYTDKTEHLFQWAIRLEDYQYDDSPEDLAQTIKKLHDLVRTQMPFLQTKGMIILTAGGTNNFNITKLAQPLSQNGMDYCSLQKLMAHCKASQMEILNEMPASGRLLRIQHEKELLQATINDIILLDFMPDKLPPVAGIITLVPQTPLSHVNLLAKNRGTLNLYTNLAEMPQLNTYMGKWVHISVNSHQLSVGSANKEIIFTEITEAEAKAENEKRKPKPLSIPTPNTDSPYLISLTGQYAQTFGSTEYIGAKAANYAFLLSFLDKKYIRPAYALSFALYESVILNSTNVNSLILNLLRQKDSLSAAEIQAKLKEIRKNIKAAHIDKSLLFGLTINLYKTYPNTKIRLRSSTNCEDLPRFNGAGLYLSEGLKTTTSEAFVLPYNDYVKVPEQEKVGDSLLQKKILKVYASLWTWEAFQEREYYGIDHSKAAMAILIHEAFVEEDANGVALVQENENGDLNLLINAQAGGNEVVSPENDIISESFWVNSETGKIAKILSHSNIENTFLENGDYATLLPDLSAQAFFIYQRFKERQAKTSDMGNYGIDIEFKITKEGELYIKQARLLNEVLPE